MLLKTPLPCLFAEGCGPDTVPWLTNLITDVIEPGQLAQSTPVLQLDGAGLCLRGIADPKAAPTRVDFAARALQYRVQTSSRSEGLLKAIGLDKHPASLSVIDAMAGLGTDGYVMAAFGADVVMVEKSPLMATLLLDGLERGRQGESRSNIGRHLARLALVHDDAHDYFASLAASAVRPDVIYLDPMFPVRKKSAAVKKDMALMQQFLSPNDDVASLLSQACGLASKRVVLKRPGKPGKDKDNEKYFENDQGRSIKADFVVSGKACHFQVFLCHQR